MRSLALMLSLSILIFACAPRTEPMAPMADAGTAAASPEAGREAVDLLRRTWVEAAERKDAAAVAALYSDDAVIASPLGETARGRQAIESLWQTQLPMSDNLRVNPSTVEAASDMVAEYGTFSQQLTLPGGTPQDVDGEYVVVTRRQNDGDWRIVMHMTFVRMPEGQAMPAATATGTR
jgi:uncharacterized protein (TIGR02246 family)